MTAGLRRAPSRIAIFVGLVLLGGRAEAVVVETAFVGNPGNMPDIDRGIGQLGAVNYAFRIGIFEVTNSQYAEFLNAKAATDPLRLYSESMGSDPRGGIMRDGDEGSFTYSPRPNMGNKPVNFVNWYDAARFVNWLHNGQGAGDTESGAYTLEGGTPFPSHGATITRNPDARWFIPSIDEWYKAAYHQPAEHGGDSDGYWLYPTQTNTPPAIATANGIGDISNPGENVANHDHGAEWNGLDGNVTTVGSAGPLSASYYGTFDQGGNVVEWMGELDFASPQSTGNLSGMRGGYWFGSANTLSTAYWWTSHGAVSHTDNVGFRVASVPEPSGLILAAVGVGLWLTCSRRTRGRTVLNRWP